LQEIFGGIAKEGIKVRSEAKNLVYLDRNF
jgi:hypothetical protein